MLPILRNALLSVSKRLSGHTMLISPFHVLSKPIPTHPMIQNNLLAPATQSFIPSCGFKVMGKVRRRCKDCYFVRRGERMFVECKTHPRHKQRSTVKSIKNTWILSHATQSKVRPW